MNRDVVEQATWFCINCEALERGSDLLIVAPGDDPASAPSVAESPASILAIPEEFLRCGTCKSEKVRIPERIEPD